MKRIIQIIFTSLTAFLLMTSFTLVIFPISVIVSPLNWRTRFNITIPSWHWFFNFAIHIGFWCKVHKEDRRVDVDKKSHAPEGLFIANHQSMVDIPLLMSQFQSPPIMKQEVLYVPIFGVCAYSSGALIVNRSKGSSRKKTFDAAVERLSKGQKSLQYYPEGTRRKKGSKPKPSNKIKKALMSYAYENNIIVYPISLYGTENVLTKNFLVNYSTKIGAIYHNGLNPKDYNSSDDFIEACWGVVLSGYEELEAKLN